MKKFIVILLLINFTFGSAVLEELTKLPVMVEHYYEHKALDPDMNILTFICMHYAHGNVKDADYDRDMQLPFKTVCFDHIISAYDNIRPEGPYIVRINSSENTSILRPTEKSFHLLHVPHGIWQPPRIS